MRFIVGNRTVSALFGCIPQMLEQFFAIKRHNNALIFPLGSAHYLTEMTMAIAEAR
jgi:hypothetical protein